MGLRQRILLPATALAVALSVWVAFGTDSAAVRRWGVPGGLLLVIAALAIGIERHVRRPILERLASAPDTRIDPVAAVLGDHAALLARLERESTALARSLDERRLADEAAREAEERYLHTVRSASDGQWEWDLGSAEVLVSPRWHAMVGEASGEQRVPFPAWLQRVHPAERETFADALDDHVHGRSDRLEHEHRLAHRDGTWRWVASRAMALRHASGRPYRVLGLDSDITRSRRAEDILARVAEGTATCAADEFFRNLVSNFARALQVRFAFVTECADQPPTRVRTLAFWAGDAFRDNFEYELPGTPCESVICEGRTTFYPTGLGQRFPIEATYESYIGVPILGSGGTVIGHLAFLDDKPMTQDMVLPLVYRIFTSRAAAEIERRHALERLAALTAPRAREARP